MLRPGMKSGILASLLLILVLVIPLVSQSSVSASNFPLTLTDDLGRQVIIAASPQRIVSLAPSNTEILFALGLGDKVVGVTSYCDYPPEASSKQSIGGPYTPSVDTIVALHPDLVLAADINPTATITQLTDVLHLTVFGIQSVDTNDVLHDIMTVGQITDREAAATTLTNNMQSRINAVTAATAGLTQNQRPRVLHIMWHNPPWTAGNGTYINDLIEKAGGVNLFHDVSGYQQVSPETIIARDPQVIIVTAMGGTSSGTWDWAIDPNGPLRVTSAFLSHRIYYVNSNWLERSGPRIVLGLEALVEDLHPGIFTPSNASEDTTKETLRSGSLGAAAQLVKGMEAGQAATMLSDEMVMPTIRAAQILEQLDTISRTNVAMAMDGKSLEKILPEVTPEKLFEIPASQLFSKFPDVPAEQLTSEIPPTLSTNVSNLTEKEITYSCATYQANELQAGQWTDFLGQLSPASQFSSGCPFTGLMVKPNANLKDVQATVKILAPVPAELTQPEGYPYCSLYYQISLDGMPRENIEAARLTFKLQRYVVDFMSQNRWSIMLCHWDSDSKQWTQIPTKRLGEDNNYIYYSAIVPGFSIYTITGSKEIPEPGFTVSDLTITPDEAGIGEKVTITAEVTNLTDEVKAYPASLWINQTVDQAKDVEIPAKGKESISFTVTKQDSSEYQVRIDRLTGSFEVSEDNASLRIASQADTTPPEITSFSPEGTVTPGNITVSATYTDTNSGIDLKQVKLLVDGQDVTSGANVSNSEIAYKPNHQLKMGAHDIELDLYDLSGNKVSKSWTFTLNYRLPSAEGFSHDLDSDGLNEDINGDGIFNSDDWTLLFKDISDPAVQAMGNDFDFNRDGVLDFSDVVQLFRKSIPSTLAVSVSNIKAEAGQTVSLPVILYHADDGLSGFDLTISMNRLVAEFDDIEIPGFGTSQVQGEFPCSKVSITAVGSKSDDKQTVLAQLKIKALSPGETKIYISIQGMYDENGKPLNPKVIEGQIIVD